MAIHCRQQQHTLAPHRNETPSVGRGHVPAVREAADSRHEHACTYLVVPTLGLRHVLSPTGSFMTMPSEVAFSVIARSAATRQRSRSRGTSVTDAAYPLRVQSRAGTTYFVQTSHHVIVKSVATRRSRAVAPTMQAHIKAFLQKIKNF